MPKKRSLFRRNQSFNSSFRLFEEGLKPEYGEHPLESLVPGVSFRNEARLQQENAFTAAFYRHLEDFTHSLELGFIIRSKPLGTQNSRPDQGSPKTIATKAKTASPENAESGHLPLAGEEVVNWIGENPLLARVKYQPKPGADPIEVYATFEMQSINSVLSFVKSGKYTLVGPSTMDPENPHIVIRDKAGKHFMIDLSATELAKLGADSTYIATVSDRIGSFRSPTPNMLQKLCNQRNIDGSQNVRLLRCEVDEHGNVAVDDNGERKVNRNPHILCDENGVPIKGDVDCSATLMRDDLPVSAYSRIDFKTRDELVAALHDLLKELNESTNNRYNWKLRGAVEAGIKMLENLPNDPPYYAADARVRNLGAVSLVVSGVILGLPDQEIQHGDESKSPILPENFTVMVLPDPARKGKSIVTHNEYEFVQSMLLYAPLTKDRVMDINPCWLVEGAYADEYGNQTNWRKDLDPADMKAKYYGAGTHTCENVTEERINIQLWKLLLEKMLLEYKQKYGEEKFHAYVNVMQENWQVMLKASTGNPELHRLQQNGFHAARAIIVNCQSAKDIPSRLESIEAEAKGIKQNKEAAEEATTEKPNQPETKRRRSIMSPRKGGPGPGPRN